MIKLEKDQKLNIHLKEIDGFSMEDYNFDVEVFVFENKRKKYTKSEMKRVDKDNYLLPMTYEDALPLGKGRLNFLINAEIPDADFPDGIRHEPVLICTEIMNI